jgi:hypothetical protein
MRKQSVYLTLGKDVEVEVTGDYTHDNFIEDCEFIMTNIKQTRGSLLQLIEYLDEAKESPIIDIQSKAVDQLHPEHVERKPFLFKQ